MQKDILPIWQNMNDQLMGFVLKKVKDKDDAKDIIQDIFIKVFSKIGDLKNEDKVDSWIFQITRNSINDYFRKNSKKHKTEQITENIQDTIEANNEFSNCVIPMINSLSPKYKEALMLSEIDGITQKELAIRLNISYTGVKSRVQRGRKQLKELLIKCCAIKTDKYGNIIYTSEENCSDTC